MKEQSRSPYGVRDHDGSFGMDGQREAVGSG